MPRSRFERLLLLVGLVALAGVALLALRGWQRYHRGPATVTTRAATVTRTTVTRRREPRRAATVTRPAAVPSHVLVVRAAGGASWLAVRSPTATGRVLYEGILAQGRSLRFQGGRFWVRAGAAANLSASFDGRPVRGFPTGTVTMTIVDGAAHVLG